MRKNPKAVLSFSCVKGKDRSVMIIKRLLWGGNQNADGRVVSYCHCDCRGWIFWWNLV